MVGEVGVVVGEVGVVVGEVGFVVGGVSKRNIYRVPYQKKPSKKKTQKKI